MKSKNFLGIVILGLCLFSVSLMGALPKNWSRGLKLDQIKVYRGAHEGVQYLFFATLVKSPDSSLAREKADLILRTGMAEAMVQEFFRQWRAVVKKNKKMALSRKQERQWGLKIKTLKANVSGARIFEKLSARRGRTTTLRVLGGMEYELFMKHRQEAIAYAWQQNWLSESKAKETQKIMQGFD